MEIVTLAKQLYAKHTTLNSIPREIVTLPKQYS